MVINHNSGLTNHEIFGWTWKEYIKRKDQNRKDITDKVPPLTISSDRKLDLNLVKPL